LFRVEVCGRLVDQVEVGRLAERHNESDALQLSTGEVLDLLVEQALDEHRLENVRVELLGGGERGGCLGERREGAGLAGRSRSMSIGVRTSDLDWVVLL
jgi:hypothetical protein